MKCCVPVESFSKCRKGRKLTSVPVTACTVGQTSTPPCFQSSHDVICLTTCVTLQHAISRPWVSIQRQLVSLSEHSTRFSTKEANNQEFLLFIVTQSLLVFQNTGRQFGQGRSFCCTADFYTDVHECLQPLRWSLHSSTGQILYTKKRRAHYIVTKHHF